MTDSNFMRLWLEITALSIAVAIAFIAFNSFKEKRQKKAL